MDVYQSHVDCIEPEDDVTIWRYMDLTRFISLLNTQALFFTTIKRLKMIDPYEGVLTIPTRTFPLPPTAEELTQFTESGYLSHTQVALRDLHQTISQPITENFVAVNCWHINEFESAAMWQLYSNFKEGVAIQSSFHRLRESFWTTPKSPCSPEGETISVSLGVVEYINYAKDRNNSGNVMSVCLTKRKSFEHERELRAITLLPWNTDFTDLRKGVSKRLKREFTNYGGVYFPVNLSLLIKSIYVAPDAPTWYVDIVKSIAKKYRCNSLVKQSDLFTDLK